MNSPDETFQLDKVVISRRRGLKNMSLRVSYDGTVRLSLPWYISKKIGLSFVNSKKSWVLKQIQNRPQPLTDEQRSEYERQAREFLPARLNELAKQGGFTYKNLRYSRARTRWGSCSQAGTISLNVQLMRLPEELIDYVIIHELCHLREMNHSPRFWQAVAELDPAYKDHRKTLRRQQPYL